VGSERPSQRRAVPAQRCQGSRYAALQMHCSQEIESARTAHAPGHTRVSRGFARLHPARWRPPASPVTRVRVPSFPSDPVGPTRTGARLSGSACRRRRIGSDAAGRRPQRDGETP
jgi:hypothetical protein